MRWRWMSLPVIGLTAPEAIEPQGQEAPSASAPTQSWNACTLTMESAMADPAQPARIVLTTTASSEEASRLGRALVDERLAACATLIPDVQSIYRWQDQVESATETLLLIKTGADRIAALEARLRQLHSYQTPEFLVLGVEACTQPYLDWLLASLRQP